VIVTFHLTSYIISHPTHAHIDIFPPLHVYNPMINLLVALWYTVYFLATPPIAVCVSLELCTI